MREIAGMEAVAGEYDGLILDLWGVVHDGVKIYPGVIDCLTRLRAAGMRMVMLSNAPRRASAAAEMLRNMGVRDELYDGVITSGEVSRAILQGGGWGRRIWHLGPPRDRNLFEGLELDEVSVSEADFVLNTGPDDERDPTDALAFDLELTQAAARKLPMLCANPDLEVVRDGKRIICAGALALRYREMGGEAVMVGKPDPLVYMGVRDRLRAARVLAVGDSLRTDIAGARGIGVDSAWVLNGLHASETDPEGTADKAGVRPTYFLRRFKW